MIIVILHECYSSLRPPSFSNELVHLCIQIFGISHGADYSVLRMRMHLVLVLIIEIGPILIISLSLIIGMLIISEIRTSITAFGAHTLICLLIGSRMRLIQNR